MPVLFGILRHGHLGRYFRGLLETSAIPELTRVLAVVVLLRGDSR